MQRALVAALALPRATVRRDALVFAARRGALVEALADAGWRVPRPEAGMYVWAPLPEAVAGDATAFCEDLVRATGVALAPGPAFGRLGAGHVRFALMRDAEVLRAAAARVGEYLRARGAT
jgi:aspartate/methionine/tyrosine aminotransferase